MTPLPQRPQRETPSAGYRKKCASPLRVARHEPSVSGPSAAAQRDQVREDPVRAGHALG